MTKYKVAVLGAFGRIGQPLSLLLKLKTDLVSELNVLDIIDPVGLGMDLSHIPTSCVVKAFTGPGELEGALTGVDLVMICAGVKCIPGGQRADLFTDNSKIIDSLVTAIAQYCPLAIVGIITNPVNSLVPVAIELMSNLGIDASKRIFGVSNLSDQRTTAFVSESLGIDPSEVTSISVGGHSEKTIVPLINDGPITSSEVVDICKKVREAGTVILAAKKGQGCSSLSTAFASLNIAVAVLNGLSGAENIVEGAYVQSNITRLPYFASPVRFGLEGIEEVFPLQTLTEQQHEMIEQALPFLEVEIQTGLDYFSN